MKKCATEKANEVKENKKEIEARIEDNSAKLRKSGVDENTQACYETLCNAVGRKRGELAQHIAIKTSSNVGPQNQNHAKSAQLALETLDEQKPKDAVEARLISQAAALYSNGMDFLLMANRTDRVDFISAYGNIAIKYMRLHNETIEALGRYRRGGEQRVTVVHVAEKMAVVNNYGGGGVDQKQGDNPCLP